MCGDCPRRKKNSHRAPPCEELDLSYDIKLVFVQKITFVLRKMNKNLLPPELHILTLTCTKLFVGWGFAPDSAGGAYSAPPDSLAGGEEAGCPLEPQ